MNHYIVISIEENKKYYSYVIKVSSSTNIVNTLNIKGIIHANLLGSKKECERIATYWNSLYKANGTYLYDKPSF